MKAIILSLLILAAVAANHSDLTSLWTHWKAKHNKSYAVAEESARFAIFVDNFNKINQKNAEHTTVKYGLNQFADLTGAEFKTRYASSGFVETDKEFVRAHTVDLGHHALPASVDWRTKGVVTPVKNQEQCGSCWAFSTTGVLEGFHAINTGTLLSFSEQQIVDCDTTCYGCDGGWPYLAMVYTAANGIEQESTYPYTGVDGTCAYNKADTTAVNTNYAFVTAESTNALLTAIVSMPVSVCIEADQDIFQLYTSGVITAAQDCGASIDHAVLAVGYDTIQGQQAFIVKNSWGATWGDDGYVYIATTQSANAGEGVCGILYQPSIPTN
jgi:C1A family cysteine protease